MKILALIPARGGSKGIPRKNVRILGDDPLIVHSIKAAQAAKSLTELICSTDDDEIAAVAVAAGATVFRRPAELATDEALTSAVALHVLEVCEAAEQCYDALLLLQPTAPFRSADDIEKSIKLFVESGADTVISVSPSGTGNPYYAYHLEGNRAVSCFAVSAEMRRQDHSPTYLRNGAIYLTKTSVLRRTHSFYGADVRAHVMPRERSVNIDDPFDWLMAELLLSQRQRP